MHSGGEEEEPSPTGSPVNMLLKAESKSSSTSSSSSSSSSDDSKNVDVEELEMLLEAYFVQIDGTSNKLSAVSRSSCSAVLHCSSRFLEQMWGSFCTIAVRSHLHVANLISFCS